MRSFVQCLCMVFFLDVLDLVAKTKFFTASFQDKISFGITGFRGGELYVIGGVNEPDG